MELHRQTCQLCGSHQLRNILIRESGETDKVFVQCAACHQLVARYLINPGGYYHAHKGYESFLKGISRSGEMMSGRSLAQEFKAVEEKCKQQFADITKQLQKEHKEN